MTLTIEVSPEVERALEERAKQTGQNLEQFVSALLTQTVRDGQENSAGAGEIEARLVALKRIGSYDKRARAGLPPLSNEDISRESIYEGRGL